MQTASLKWFSVAASFLALLCVAAVSAQGQSFTENVLYSFCPQSGCADGLRPYAGLIMDASGNLYGTTDEGGAKGYGSVFELVNSSGTYSEKVLYSFCSQSNCADGELPYAGVIMDAAGNLYGTTSWGGATVGGYYGTVFELVNSSGTYSEKVLYSFCSQSGCADGDMPYAGLIMDASGNLYGTTTGGGSGVGNSAGTVFELVNSSGSYSENVLYNFTGSNGASPFGGLIMNASGALYGTTSGGGNGDGAGVVFSLNYITSLLISSNLDPSSYGQAATFTATISTSESGDVKRRSKRKAARPQAITGTVTWSANTGCGSTQVTGSPATATCTTSSLPVGNNTITATYSGDEEGSSGDDEGSTGTLSGGQVVNQAGQAISCSGIPASGAYGSGFTASCSATSGLAVSYASSGGCSNAGASYSMTSGTTACLVSVTQSGNTDYLAAPTFNQSVTATKIDPTVSFTGLPSSLPYNNTYTLAATTNASSTADIVNSTPTICSLTSDTGTAVTLLILGDTGMCTITATWPADSNYNTASLTLSGTAVKGQAAITWATPAAIYYGTALGGTQLDASASPGNVYTTPVYSPAAGKVEAVGNVALRVTFAEHGNSKYGTTVATVTLQVLQAVTTTTVTSSDQTITLSRTGSASATVDFNVGSHKPTGTVTLSTTPAGPTCTGTVASATGDGHCKLTFTTADTYTVNASYGGDGNHGGSNNLGQNPAVTVTVNP